MSLTSSLFGGTDPNDYYNDVEEAPDAKNGAGNYTPQKDQVVQDSATQQGANALSGANGDSGAQAVQQSALQQLQQQSQGGLNAGDKAKLYQTQQAQGAQAKGAQDAIMQGAAARGQGNSGASLAAQLAAQQSGQEAGADAGEAVAGQASDRAMAATGQAANLAGSMDQAAFGKQAAIGNAQNQINANNTAATNRAAEVNAGAGNSANQFNSQQDAAQKQFYAQLLQAQYQNELNKSGMQAGTGVAEQNVDAGTLGAVSGAVGGGAGALAASNGAVVPGQAKVAGNSPKNDTVPAMLSPGEVVLSRETLAGGPSSIMSFLEKEAGIHFDSVMKSTKKSKAPAKAEK